MLKFQDILDKLSIEQKIDIICNFPSIKDNGLINDCGVIRESSYNSGEYLAESPAFFALARSWNNALIKKVSERFFAGCKDKHGISLMDLPSASVKVSPYSTGLSEDPYLTGSLVKACIDAGKSSHVATCLINPVLDKDTAEYTDKTLDSAVINDYLFKSYEYLKSNRPSVLKIDLHAGDSTFGEQNDKNVAEFSKNIPVLYSGVDSEYAFTEIFGKDKFVLGLNRSKLQDACENYDTLTERYKSGEIELSDVILSCEGGTAVSPDMLDRVVNNILTFSEYCGGDIRKSGDDQSYIVKEKSKQEKEEWFATGVAAATESTVLLKNDGVLPLKKSQSFVLYGELADYAKFQDVTLKSFLEKYAGKNFAGYAMGYSGKVLQKEKLVEAKSLFNKANIAVVAIGYNDEEAEFARKNRNCRIPAPQEALINELYNSGKKVIAILYGDCSFDMSFDDKCAAVLLASGFNKFDDYAIHKILFGQLSPSGKLINTLYANTD